ncbi:MAG: bifunctional glycosyltransferase family 2/GtrA family protein [Lachnospiraceae bacterium]|nr:bifunctional glycosyltransferase family 2/GtrA family protein [Lachnospiraceae bacterium]
MTSEKEPETVKQHIAIIPAYQPDNALTEVVRAMSEYGFSVVVVDDGSDEACQPVFQSIDNAATVLHHEKNRGKGQALRTGIAYVSEHFDGEYTIVTVDADGQHRPEDALKVTLLADEHPDALVLGMRLFTKDVPFRSRSGNAITRVAFFLSTGVKVYDTQTGLRAFSNELTGRLLEVSGNRYEYEMNVLLDFARERRTILETEIATVYIDANSKTHFRVFRDSVLIYKDILKFSASSFVSFLIDYLLYSLLLLITHHYVASNIAARVVSASVNFTLNRVVVFKSKEPILKAAIEYFLLAASILLINTLMLKLWVDVVGLHEMLAKIITEIIVFFISFTVQKLLIFRKKGGTRQ